MLPSSNDLVSSSCFCVLIKTISIKSSFIPSLNQTNIILGWLKKTAFSSFDSLCGNDSDFIPVKKYSPSSVSEYIQVCYNDDVGCQDKNMTEVKIWKDIKKLTLDFTKE